MAEPHPFGIGFSPCPNDTFAFWGLVSGRVTVPGVAFEPWLADIEALNQRAVQGRDPLPFTKLSVPALAHALDHYALLHAGAALGRGCGPLVLRRTGDEAISGVDELRGRRVAIPGQLTTARLLLGIFAPMEVELIEMRFDRIMPAVEAGEVDAGLVIHESRFTYAEHGLEMVCDLGELWEADCGLPLPLGVIAVARELPHEVAAGVDEGLKRSVQMALADPTGPRDYVREHAQEMSDAVCDQHIGLYVNQFTIDVGDEGRQAVEHMLRQGREIGLLPESGVAPWRA